MNIFQKNKIDCHQGALRAVRYNVDGQYLLTCGADKKIKLWNPKSGLLLKTYGGHGNEVTDACGSCDGVNIVSSSLDKSIIYWDVQTGQPLRRLRSHHGAVTCVKFNEDSRLAVSGSRDCLTMCWDIRTRKLEPIQILRDATDTITTIILTDTKIITSSLDGNLRFYDIRAGELLWYEIESSFTYIAQTKDDQCTLGAFADNILRLIDNENGDILGQYRGHKSYDYEIECGLLANDTQIITGTAEGTVVFYDITSGEQIHTIDFGDGVINSITTHPNEIDFILSKGREYYLYGPPESYD